MLLKASQEMVGLCVFFVARRRWRLHALDAGAKRRTLARARRAPPLTALTVRTPFDSSLLRPLRSIHQSQTEKSLRSFLKKIAAKYSSMKGEGEGEKLCYAILRRKAGEAEAAASLTSKPSLVATALIEMPVLELVTGDTHTGESAVAGVPSMVQ